jgi:hypothetical protein
MLNSVLEQHQIVINEIGVVDRIVYQGCNVLHVRTHTMYKTYRMEDDYNVRQHSGTM